MRRLLQIGSCLPLIIIGFSLHQAQAQSLSAQFLAEFSGIMDARQKDLTASVSQSSAPMPDAAPDSVLEVMADTSKMAPLAPPSVLPQPSRPETDGPMAREVRRAGFDMNGKIPEVSFSVAPVEDGFGGGVKLSISD